MLSDTERARILGLLTVTLFGAWLDEHGDTDVVGRRCHPIDCPIGRYFRATHDLCVNVTPGALFYEGAIIEDFPLWVTRLQLRLDDAGRGRWSRITAAEARRVLAEVAAPARAAGGEGL